MLDNNLIYFIFFVFVWLWALSQYAIFWTQSLDEN